MKNSKEMADSVFMIRDAYLEKQRIRKVKLKKAAYIGSSVCMFVLVLAGIHFIISDRQQISDITVSDVSESTSFSGESESETSDTPTQEELVTSSDVVDGGSIEEIIFPSFDEEENIPPHDDSDDSIKQAKDESESIIADPNGFDTWSLEDIFHSFPEISFEKKYYCADIAIGEGMLESAIADITITGYDIDTGNSISADAVVYSFIDSAENEIAVCLKGRSDYIIYRAE